MPRRNCAPTRTLPSHPNLAQLRKQAKELLKAYQSGQPAARAEVEQFEQSPDLASFALSDAQRVLARAYGFPSWAKLKQHVDGMNYQTFIAAAAAGDLVAVRTLAQAHPDLIKPDLAEFNDSALHRAIFNRDAAMTRALMQLGAEARQGIWPHRNATSAFTIAKDREYDEIVAIIEQEEERRRQSFGAPEAGGDSKSGAVLAAIRNRQSGEAIEILQSDPALVESCGAQGATPLHVAAAAHDAQTVAWLLAHGARVDARNAEGRTSLDTAAIAAGWSANSPHFPYLRNADVDPARFDEVVQLLRTAGAELTPRAAVAMGDHQAVTQMHRQGHLTNEIDFWGGGLLALAVRVNRMEMVSLLLGLGIDPDERAAPTEDGGESWGFPLWFAAACGRHEIAELLIRHGADVNSIFYASGDPLGCAQITGDRAMAELLLKHGARIAVEQVKDLETAQAILDGTLPATSLNVREPSHTDLAEQLLWASGPRNPEIVRRCLQYIQRQGDDPWWNYVLLSAALPETFRILLDHGVDPNVLAEGGYTILHHLASDYVADEKRVPLATILLDAGASMTIRDPRLQSTPLGWACRWGRKDLVDLYLKRGADPREPHADPWATPLAWATKGDHHEIVTMLHSAGADG